MGKALTERAVLTSSLLLLGALLACKSGGKTEETKKIEKAIEQATVAPLPTPPAPVPTPSASAVTSAAAPVDPIKHYGADEREETGTVKVLTAHLPVYGEASASPGPLVTLAKGTLVNRKARYQTWLLVEYPSGNQQVASGWILDKNNPVSAPLTTVKAEAVALQDAGVEQPSNAGTHDGGLDAGLPRPTSTADASAPLHRDAGAAVQTPVPSAVPTVAPVPTPTPTPAPVPTPSVAPRRRDPHQKI